MIHRPLSVAEAARFPTVAGCDAYTVTRSSLDPGNLAEIAASGAQVWYYMNVLNPPCPEWRGTFMDWVRGNMPALMSADTHLAAFFPWFGCQDERRTIIDWRYVPQDTLIKFAGVVADEAAGGVPFFDQYWLVPHEWMFTPGIGAQYGDFPVEKWRYWYKRIRRMVELVSQRGGARPILNGDWGSSALGGRLYLEHAERNWIYARSLWYSDNILSVNPDDQIAVGELIDVAMESPEKWVSFAGGSQDATDAAYAKLLDAMGR